MYYGATLYDFINGTCIDNGSDYPCYVWHSDLQKNIFDGEMCDIPDEIMDLDFESWEFDSYLNKIGFNVSGELESEEDEDDE